MKFNFELLKEKIEIAAKTAFQEIYSKHKDEEICSFALYSDEGAMTVCPSANTLEHLSGYSEEEKEHIDYYKFEPAEWKYEMVGADELFADISTMVREEVFKMEEEENVELFLKFQKKLYETCINVLGKLKEEGFFKSIVGKEIFLIFTVTEFEFDDSDIINMVTQLNDNKYKDEYLAWMKTWGSY